jgi:hypothetical protein
MQNVVYTHKGIRIVKPGKAESTSGLGRAGFRRLRLHGLLGALAASNFGPSKHANLFLRVYYQHKALNYQHSILNRCFSGLLPRRMGRPCGRCPSSFIALLEVWLCADIFHARRPTSRSPLSGIVSSTFPCFVARQFISYNLVFTDRNRWH